MDSAAQAHRDEKRQIPLFLDETHRIEHDRRNDAGSEPVPGRGKEDKHIGGDGERQATVTAELPKTGESAPVDNESYKSQEETEVMKRHEKLYEPGEARLKIGRNYPFIGKGITSGIDTDSRGAQSSNDRQQ